MSHTLASLWCPEHQTVKRHNTNIGLTGSWLWRGFFRVDGGCGLVFGQLAGPWFHVNLKHSFTVMEFMGHACMNGWNLLEVRPVLAAHSS